MRNQLAEILQQQLVSLQSVSGNPCALPLLLDVPELPDPVRIALRRAIDLGFTLRSQLPPIDGQLLVEWLGRRWWFIHRTQFERQRQWTAVIGSRLDRTAKDFSQWPRWIENAVRVLARDDRTLLLVAGTTTAALIEPLARSANVDWLQLRLPTPSRQGRAAVGAWLIQCIDQAWGNPSVAKATLLLSEAIEPPTAQLEHLPFRDRLAVALAHRVIAMAVRPQGNIAQLLTQRLKDVRFPDGTVGIRLPGEPECNDIEWLERRTVGWYLPTREHRRNPPIESALHCRAMAGGDSASTAVVQWTASARLWQGAAEYLVHCVRGNDGAAFRSGRSEAVLEAIARGEVTITSPFETLLKIISSRRLRASGKLMRTGISAVSFTAVSLAELLARRRYQSHLARWDWEPFGLMIRRDVLEQLGARPVIYGDEQLFEHLDSCDRPFYQPARRRSARGEQEHWQSEQEWRLLDDVRLSELPMQSLILFVEHAAQAQALAARYPWPVICLQANQTARSPASARTRRRSPVRTNKS